MSPKVRSPVKLLVRCLATPTRDGQWQAFSLEFGLAVQGESFPEVKRKLELMIASYLFDALVGQDRDHAGELLHRRAPIGIFVRFHLVRLLGALLRPFMASLNGKGPKAFFEPMPLQPASC